MNLVLLDPSELEETGTGEIRVRLTGRRFGHLRDVHRAQVGETLRVGVLGGGTGRGRLLAGDARSFEMAVTIDSLPPPPSRVQLVLALPRPLVLKRVLLHATSLGVKRIALIHTRRVEKSYWQSDALSGESLREQLVLGLEQSGDTVLPDLTLHPRFRPFAEDDLSSLLTDTQGIVAHPDATAECPRALEERVTVAIGPEGGFVPFEIDKLEDAGMTAVRLGDRVMRVEAAVPFVLARLT